eukprot:2012009-Rhodomonas_salina.1
MEVNPVMEKLKVNLPPSCTALRRHATRTLTLHQQRVGAVTSLQCDHRLSARLRNALRYYGMSCDTGDCKGMAIAPMLTSAVSGAADHGRALSSPPRLH